MSRSQSQLVGKRADRLPGLGLPAQQVAAEVWRKQLQPAERPFFT
jgi:hypothetical protein